MTKTKPYQIIHIKLNKDHDLSLVIKPNQKYYLVFWWKTIPLGNLYINENGVEDLERTILKVIIPTLTYYGLKKTGNIEGLLSSKREHFFKQINSILTPFINKKIPKKVDVSVVICTRNRSESLKKCLNKLQNQTCQPSEVLVIDNAPFDNTTEKVVKQFSNVNYYIEPTPGLSFARNLGVKQAKNAIIAFTDDDVEVDKLWIFNIWDTFKNNNIDALTGLIIASSLETESQQIFEKYWGFNKGYQDIYFDKKYLTNSTEVPRIWELGAGANMAFRKDIICKLNYFDERLGAGASGCSEDSELWFRMLLENSKIQYNPRIIVFHEHRSQITQLKKQLFSYMKGHVVAALIHHSQNKTLGYKKYIFNLPKYYLLLFRLGFPNYRFRYKTLWAEFTGYFSGIKFYILNKNKPAITKK
ncbi:family 2 glycosyl transferase [Tamlana nanhaiensis]|uniref:Family 2 glycosyl transferase n=1 Tax=Neotamlana nanhaiensis TaxID=1382798 RepID=A0A0D7W6R6_9FLAO|nr:glycosyltransferase [Tamlana nanhaiensis]KJD34801.1 family 2 glycosyl transferase [Tamlana nanhaiensis]